MTVSAKIVAPAPAGSDIKLAADKERSTTSSGKVERSEEFFEKGVHPLHAPAMPSHEEMKASPHFPVFVTPNPMVPKQTFNGVQEHKQQIAINGPSIPLDSELFSGQMQVHLRGLSSTQKPVFEGKKRFFHIMVQGKFKRPVGASALCMGQEFVKAGNVPPWVGEVVLTAAAKVFSNSTQVDVYAPLPYFMNPILAACQLINVAKDGEQPDMAAATEDMRLWSSDLVDKKGLPLAADRRRKWCDVAKNLEGRTFDTEHVWTFHIWQHLIDFSSYRLSVGGFLGLDLTAALNGQPLQLTCKDTETGEYSFSMLVWHEQLLYPADSTAASRLAERLKGFNLMGGFRSMLTRSK
jgi:hypothetical protein